MTLLHSELAYRLTTAEIIYRRPDHPSLLQEYIWQEFDLLLELPKLKKFLRFWEAELDGKLFSVRVASAELLKPADYNWSDGRLLVH